MPAAGKVARVYELRHKKGRYMALSVCLAVQTSHEDPECRLGLRNSIDVGEKMQRTRLIRFAPRRLIRFVCGRNGCIHLEETVQPVR